MSKFYNVTVSATDFTAEALRTGCLYGISEAYSPFMIITAKEDIRHGYKLISCGKTISVIPVGEEEKWNYKIDCFNFVMGAYMHMPKPCNWVNFIKEILSGGVRCMADISLDASGIVMPYYISCWIKCFVFRSHCGILKVELKEEFGHMAKMFEGIKIYKETKLNPNY